MRDQDVQTGDPAPHLDLYNRIQCTVRAHASLDEIVDFLYGFYSAGHLHQIRTIENLKPVPNSRDYELHMTIEALALRDATSEYKLSTETGHSLKLTQASAYHEIGKRNFFARYVPPRPTGEDIAGRGGRVPPIPPARFDSAKYTFVVGFTNGEKDGRRAWLKERTSDKLWQLAEGEEFTVAGSTGKIIKIEPDGDLVDPNGKVILQFGAKTRACRLGDDLTSGKDLEE